MELEFIALACVAAFIAAMVDAIAGGGGVILMPAMMYLGLPIQQVLGTNKFVAANGTLLAASNFIRRKQFSGFVLKFALPCTCVGALLGSACASIVSPEILKPVVCVAVVAIALYFFFRPELGRAANDPKPLTSRGLALACASAFAIGFYDGIFGPGTGAFLMFVFIRFFAQDFLLAAGNTKILNLASNVMALGVFAVKGHVYWSIGIPMAVASMIGGYWGAQIAVYKGASWVRWVFIVMAVLVAGRLLF